MSSIEKRHSRQGTRYRVRVRLRGGRPASSTFPTLQQARHWGARTESAVLSGRDLPQPEGARHTVRDMIIRYTQQVLPRLSTGTAHNRMIHLSWWGSTIGYLMLVDVTRGRLVECREHLAHTRSAGTTNRYLSTLGHVLSVAMQWEWLQRNPMQTVQKMRLPPPRTRYLSDPERHRLLEACQGSPNRMLYVVVMLALATGARKMEVLSLHWGDIDLRRRELTFRITKTRRVRVVPLAEHIVDLVRDHGRVRRLDTPFVFPRPDGLQPADIRHSWYQALTKAAIVDFRFHDLRHSFASYTAMAGASVLDLQALLGHSSPAMSARYTHLSPAHLAGVVSRMTSTIQELRG